MDMVKKYEEEVKADAYEMSERKINKTEDNVFVNSQFQLAITEHYLDQYENMLERNGYKYSDFTAYSFRHTVCTRLMKVTDLKTVQKIMGDRNPTVILQYYANMPQEEMDIATEKVAEGLELVFSENV